MMIFCKIVDAFRFPCMKTSYSNTDTQCWVSSLLATAFTAWTWLSRAQISHKEWALRSCWGATKDSMIEIRMSTAETIPRFPKPSHAFSIEWLAFWPQHSNTIKAHWLEDSLERIGSETLVDILNLASCKHMIHGSHPIAEAALYWNPNMTSTHIEKEWEPLLN